MRPRVDMLGVVASDHWRWPVIGWCSRGAIHDAHVYCSSLVGLNQPTPTPTKRVALSLSGVWLGMSQASAVFGLDRLDHRVVRLVASRSKRPAANGQRHIRKISRRSARPCNGLPDWNM